MKLPIVFLDLDGVINSHSSSGLIHDSHSSSGLIHDSELGHTYDPELCAILSSLFSEVEVAVVVSSTWRFGRTIQELNEVLHTIGICCTVISKTPFNGNFNELRGNEIKWWLESNGNPENYVIIDDDEDMLECQLNRFVNVNNVYGFTKSDLSEAIKIIKSFEVIPCQES